MKLAALAGLLVTVTFLSVMFAFTQAVKANHAYNNGYNDAATQTQQALDLVDRSHHNTRKAIRIASTAIKELKSCERKARAGSS